MTTADFINVWCDDKLRELIDDLAIAFTRDESQQDTLRAIAVIAIGHRNRDKTCEYYYRIAYTAMRKHYAKYQMEKPKRWISDDAGIQRANNKLKIITKSHG